MDPDFDPALCVVHDEDYKRAVELLREHVAEGTEQHGEETVCANCGEKNPGNFMTCWNCEKPLVH